MQKNWFCPKCGSADIDVYENGTDCAICGLIDDHAVTDSRGLTKRAADGACICPEFTVHPNPLHKECGVCGRPPRR